MPTLAVITVFAGLCLLALGLPLAAFPRRTMETLERFPRNVNAGRVLATAALAWALWMLLNAQINWVNEHRRLVYILAPAAWFLVMFFMDELLAPRALGGIMLLAPMPILDAAFLESSPKRLVMVILAYLLAIAGMVLVWSPYMFRKTAARCLATTGQHRAWSGALLLGGLALIALGLSGY